MGSPSKFAAVNTKINAMYSKLLKNDEFEALLYKDNLKSIVEFLQEKLEIEGLKNMSITDIEFQLEKYRYNKIKRLRSYFKETYLDFFDALLLEYEINDIKMVLHKLQIGENIDLKKDNFFQLSKNKILIPKDNATISSYLEQIKSTEYYRLLQAYENEDKEKILFYMTMSLDKLYYQNIINKSAKLNKKDREYVKVFIGRRVDILNIIWIYRAIKNYHLISGEIFNFTIMGTGLLKIEDLKELAYIDKIEDFIVKIKEGPYEFLVDSSHDIDLYMNRRNNRYIYYLALGEYHKSKFDIRSLLAFNYIFTFETKDLISILEGRRFDISSEEMKQFLIRRLEGSDSSWL